MRNVFAIIVLFSGSLLVLSAGEEKSDLDRMQGTWVVQSLTEKGKALPGKDIENLEVVIEKDILTATEKGKVIVKCQIKVDVTKKPKAIDFTYLIGDDKGKSEPGIYQFEKDQFTFVLDEDKKGRPTAFAGEGTESYSIHVMKKKEAK